MANNPYQIVSDFESALCAYTGAPYAVTTNSCTNALLLCLVYKRHTEGFAGVQIPKKTYCSVPQVIKHSGHRVEYRDEEWQGSYRLDPFNIYDCARWFSGEIFQYHKKQNRSLFVCCSFHASKTLGDTQGGAILHDDPEADLWFRRARFDGRTEGVHPKEDKFDMLGYHCYMSPDVAARLLLKLSVLPKNNDPLPNDDYPDLSKYEIFK